MPPFVTRAWLDGRANGTSARWNAAAVNDLEARIATAIGTGTGGGGAEVVDQGTITVDTTLNMATHQDVWWVVTLGASNLKLEISNWATTKSVVLELHQDATGGRTVLSLPTALWEGGAVPTGSTGANAVDIRSFVRGLTQTFGFDSGTGMA
jgi:hypothetical protein